MAINPNLRVTTGKTSIPLGVAKAGTFTVNGTHTDRLTYSGTAAALDAILAQGRENPEQTKDNLWIYMDGLGTNGTALRVISWGGQTVKIDGDATGANAETWTLVEANLSGWSIFNGGGSAGVVSDVSLASGATVSFSDAPEATYRRRYVDCICVNGTGTSLYIQEKQ